MRQVQDTLTTHYAETWQSYQTAVQTARNRLENLSAWAHLADEERQEYIVALTWGSPSAPDCDLRQCVSPRISRGRWPGVSLASQAAIRPLASDPISLPGSSGPSCSPPIGVATTCGATCGCPTRRPVASAPRPVQKGPVREANPVPLSSPADFLRPRDRHGLWPNPGEGCRNRCEICTG